MDDRKLVVLAGDRRGGKTASLIAEALKRRKEGERVIIVDCGGLARAAYDELLYGAGAMELVLPPGETNLELRPADIRDVHIPTDRPAPPSRNERNRRKRERRKRR